jgi:hypothetical protein
MNLSLRDCVLRGGAIEIGLDIDNFNPEFPSWGSGSLQFVNNTFDNVGVSVEPTAYEAGWGMHVDLAFTARNNLFRSGPWFHLEPIPASAGNWTLTDNFFDRADIIQDVNFGAGYTQPLDFGYNGYWPLTTNELRWDHYLNPWGYLTNSTKLQATATSDGSTEVVLSSPAPYAAGPFGKFYLSATTPLYQAGSQTAGDAGLTQYTTLSSQEKDSSTAPVSIGLHYVPATNSAALDSDNDGVPDYVEVEHGTDPNNVMTDGLTNDAYNAAYDDVDLSGSGLVGRIKKALGLEPLNPGNPLTLRQIITGEEPDFATFEVPVSYDAVAASGTLSMSMNGLDVTLGECARATNGNCLLSFNVDFDPAGPHLLSPAFRVNADPMVPYSTTAASGFVQSYYSSNSLQFDVNGSMFDDSGAYLDARLFAQSADYTIDLYDTTTNPAAWILTITNSTSTGTIQENWGVTNSDGTPFGGTSVQAVFAILPPGTLSSSGTTANSMDKKAGPPHGPAKHLTRYAGATREAGPNFDFVYMYTPTNSALSGAFGNINGNPGVIWMGMQGVVNTLLTPVEASGGHDDHYYSSFDRCTSQDFPGQPGIPGYLTSRTTVTNVLLPDMVGTQTRQFYASSHGSYNRISSASNDVYIDAGELGRLAGNISTKSNYVSQTPYRFVFLDGCSTASTLDWARAFGIYPLSEADAASRNSVGPQAYVGWWTTTQDWMGGTDTGAQALNLAQAYTRTLQVFYENWMDGLSLKECIANASNLAQNNMVPFAVPHQNYLIVYGDGWEYRGHIFTSPIVVIGHSGLAIDTTHPDRDGAYAMPKK